MQQILLVVFVLVFALPLQMAIAQEINVGQPADQESVEAYITSDGIIQIKHTVSKSSIPVQIDLIAGTPENIEVTDVNGKELQHAMINGNLGILFFPSSEDIIVKYDLADALVNKDGLWVWNYRYLETTQIFPPENIKTVYINNQPITLDENRGINCHGCQMVLEYFEDDNIQNEKVVWESHEFTVPIIALTEIESFSFDQDIKAISFKVTEPDKFITLILAQELLGPPYETYLDDEKLMKFDYITNATHVWLDIKPISAGTVTIIGTTVIPEFSMFLPLIIGITLIVALQYRNKLSLR